MYQVKIIKNPSLEKLEEHINTFLQEKKNINNLNVNISESNIEESLPEYIATIIYQLPLKICL